MQENPARTTAQWTFPIMLFSGSLVACCPGCWLTSKRKKASVNLRPGTAMPQLIIRTPPRAFRKALHTTSPAAEVTTATY